MSEIEETYLLITTILIFYVLVVISYLFSMHTMSQMYCKVGEHNPQRYTADSVKCSICGEIWNNDISEKGYIAPLLSEDEQH